MTFDRFFGHDIDFDLAMKPFTWQHGVLILLGILCIVLTLFFAKQIKNLSYERKIKRGFAIWLIVLELIYHTHYWAYGLFSVPLHLCSFGVMFSIAILLTDSKKVFDFLFFIGTFGGLLALFFPNTLGYTYYNIRYYHFILLHMSIAIVPIYYYKAYGYRVTLKSIYKVVALILCVSPLVVYVNYTFDKNYMFIGEKPEIIAKFLPDWPYYILVLLVLGFIMMHILYYVSNFDYSKIKMFSKDKK